MIVKDLIKLLEKYPDDIKVVIGIESEGELGIYYNIQCGGLDTGNEKLFYVASKDLSEDITMFKSSDYSE